MAAPHLCYRRSGMADMDDPVHPPSATGQHLHHPQRTFVHGADCLHSRRLQLHQLDFPVPGREVERDKVDDPVHA